MSFLNKVKAGLNQAGKDVTKFATNVGTTIGEGSKQASSGFKLENECEKASKTLASFLADPDHPESALNSIPKAVLQRAKGLAIFTVLKAGFVWSGKVGSGIVIARLEDGSWSAPSCIATGGVGFGLQVGADYSEFVVVLNSADAVKAFAQGGNVTIGGQLSGSVGPIGTGGAVTAALSHPTPLYTYSQSKGLFAGLSLEGTVLIERKDTNAAFYGQPIPAFDLLTGKVPPPEAASRVYDILEASESINEDGIPQQSYVPPSVSQPNQPVFDAGTEH